MRHRLQECSSRSGPAIISQGAELFDALIAARAGVVQAMPPLQARVDGLRRQAPAYLVQEYLHNERSEEHTSELQSLMRISYAVLCLKKKTITNRQNPHNKK